MMISPTKTLSKPAKRKKLTTPEIADETLLARYLETADRSLFEQLMQRYESETVSYTHLTLPTIYSV